MRQLNDRHNDLYLHEEILLLALREHDGKTFSHSHYRYYMAAALLAELVLHDRIEIADDRKMSVHLKSDRPIDEALIDKALTRIASTSRNNSAKYWVTKFERFNNLRDGTGNKLCARNILKKEEDTILFFFNRTVYPELNPRPENELVARLSKVIFSAPSDADERTIVLLALLRKSKLLNIHFDKTRLYERRHHMKRLTQDHSIGQATARAIQAAEAAIAATIVAATVVTTG